MSFEKTIANREWFANNVEAGDSVSFVYNGLQRFGEVVESVRRRQPNDSSTSVRGWLTLEMTVPLQDREDVNGKMPSKFKRFNWDAMTRCEKYWTLNCGWKSQGENNMYNMQEFMEWHEYLELVDKLLPDDKIEWDRLDSKIEELER